MKAQIEHCWRRSGCFCFYIHTEGNAPLTVAAGMGYARTTSEAIIFTVNLAFRVILWFMAREKEKIQTMFH
jgi:hypothetical protein